MQQANFTKVLKSEAFVEICTLSDNKLNALAKNNSKERPTKSKLGQ
jgi:hypothetical protein